VVFGSDILDDVTKRLIEVDDEKLARVRNLLGTSTLKSTVDSALDEVLALDQRRRALLAERGHEDSLADSDRRQAAWR
jgi:Arc/MetJ family transcription regulator